MAEDRIEYIECPNCKAQYHPAEIFIPNSFFGRPLHVERDKSRRILDVFGEPADLTEHFTCEYCNKPFKIRARVQFSTKSEAKFDFDSEYTTKLKKESLFLNEDDDNANAQEK